MKTPEQIIRDFAFEQWDDKSPRDIALKLCEEAGEVAGAAVKIREGRAKLRDMDDEVGDVLIVLSQYAAQRETTLDELRKQRFVFIQARARLRCAACDRGDYTIGHAEGCPAAEALKQCPSCGQYSGHTKECTRPKADQP